MQDSNRLCTLSTNFMFFFPCFKSQIRSQKRLDNAHNGDKDNEYSRHQSKLFTRRASERFSGKLAGKLADPLLKRVSC